MRRALRFARVLMRKTEAQRIAFVIASAATVSAAFVLPGCGDEFDNGCKDTFTCPSGGTAGTAGSTSGGTGAGGAATGGNGGNGTFGGGGAALHGNGGKLSAGGEGASLGTDAGSGGEAGAQGGAAGNAGAPAAGGETNECDPATRWCAGQCRPYTEQCSCIGLGNVCGPALKENCCQRPAVPGGAFNRRNDSAYPAEVSPFRLDRFEVTVGRFRAFLNAGFSTQGNPPPPHAGSNSNNGNDPGWNSEWNRFLPIDATDFESSLEKCPWSGWTAGGGDSLPMTCINWYVAYAFCIWDGGRLPTEAEWNFAAAGGGGSDGQRYYPWSSPPDDTTLNNSLAVYETTAAAAVGSRSPKGDAKWGHADMAGNAGEIVLDYSGELPPCTGVEHDCANLTPNAAHEAVMRGGYFTNFTNYSTTARSSQDKQAGWFAQGFRCAYNN